MWSRSSWILPRRKCTKSALVSRTISTASGRIRFRISVVKVPTPGPYSRNTRAPAQSTSLSTLLTRKRELGMRLPSILGCLMKLRPKSRICSDREVRCAGTVGNLPFNSPARQPAGHRTGRRRLAESEETCRRLLASSIALHVAFAHGGVSVNVDRRVTGDDHGVLRGPGHDRGVGVIHSAGVPPG